MLWIGYKYEKMHVLQVISTEIWFTKQKNVDSRSLRVAPEFRYVILAW